MSLHDPGTGLRSEDRVASWERRSAAGLTVLAVAFLVVYAAPILYPQLPPRWRAVCVAANIAIWLLFWVDYAVRLWLADDRWRFVRGHAFDLVVLLLPVLRPLRMLRLVTAVLTLTRRTEIWARGRLALYVGSTTVLLVIVSGLAVLDAERADPDGAINSYPDALWWAVVTITTVGYGDYFPVTTTGRFVALALMIGGIGLIGFVTGSLASWIVERISTASAEAEAAEDEAGATEAAGAGSAAERTAAEAGTAPATRADVAALTAQLVELRAEVAALRADVGGPASVPQQHRTADATPATPPPSN
ncbi:potassium channel family protein [Solwaraspora sp. WMMA2101]|uniref:potassium channel family protein n=1 Tax=Solwaraspora sp. WMMA2101 TaxID=3404124 RepID=UPI003B965474